MRNLTAVAIKWAVAFFTLVVWGQASGSVTADEAAGVALVLAVVSWLADRLFPFRLQGVTRWAIDGGLAALTVYFTEMLWPGPRIGFLTALVIGYFLGALELPLHFFLAARYGVRRPEDDKDGIR